MTSPDFLKKSVCLNPLRRITLGDLQGFAQSLWSSAGLAPISRMRERWRGLRACRASASGCVMFPSNPSPRNFRCPAMRRGWRNGSWSEEDVERLLAEADAESPREPRPTRICSMPLGSRVSEACGLLWRNVRPRGDAGQITVFGKNADARDPSSCLRACGRTWPACAMLLGPRIWCSGPAPGSS